MSRHPKTKVTAEPLDGKHPRYLVWRNGDREKKYCEILRRKKRGDDGEKGGMEDNFNSGHEVLWLYGSISVRSH